VGIDLPAQRRIGADVPDIGHAIPIAIFELGSQESNLFLESPDHINELGDLVDAGH